jgi:archaemetzincin
LTSTAGHTILITPGAGLAAEHVAAVRRIILEHFGLPAEVRPLLQDLGFAFDPARSQYHSTPILGRLAAEAPPWALKVIALVAVDLFIPILTHVYGEAQLGGRACIVSTFRLDEGRPGPHDEKALAARLVKESVHELGHTFRLRHCPDTACIMHYCRSEADVDRKSDHLCRYCRILLDDELIRLGRR